MPNSSEPAGPVGDGEYEVQPGDCVESVAHRAGHFWQTIWDHPRNAALKAARKNPNVLLPGDRLHVPPLRLKEVGAATDGRHSFVRRGVPSKLRVCVQQGGKPRKNEPYRLDVDGQIFEGVTDGAGFVEVAIPPSASRGELIVGAGRTNRQVFHLDLGGMDPITTVSGVQKRLQNLGYPCGLSGQMDDDTSAAIALFQKSQDLPPTGELDQQTRDKLQQAHGS